MAREVLHRQLVEFVNKTLTNGIVQHSAEWDKAKTLTIGGSQISTLMGNNIFSNINTLVADKIGLNARKSDIKIHWGSLFERLIKKYAEHDKKTEIIGSEIFVPGPPNTSYSPDGLGVIEIEGQLRRALFEFKCPFSRVPNGKTPRHYVPQVKYGLDILHDTVDIGLFVDGVFRRCKWDELGRNTNHDLELVGRAQNALPLAYGFIGFYLDIEQAKAATASADRKELDKIKSQLNAHYKEEFNIEVGTNDLGEASTKLIETIFASYSIGLLAPWYSEMIFVDDDYQEQSALAKMLTELNKYEEFCQENSRLNFGILPYKLFTVQYNYIEYEAGFVEKWRPKIDQVIDIVKQCIEAPPAEKIDTYNRLITQLNGGGFID